MLIIIEMRFILFFLIFTFALPAISNCCEPCFGQDEASCQVEAIKDNCNSESDHNSEASEGFIPCICSCSQRVLQASSAFFETRSSTIFHLFPEEILCKEAQFVQAVFHPPIS